MSPSISRLSLSKSPLDFMMECKNHITHSSLIKAINATFSIFYDGYEKAWIEKQIEKYLIVKRSGIKYNNIKCKNRKNKNVKCKNM